MCEITIDPRYDSWRCLIDNMRRRGIEWNQIADYCGVQNDRPLQDALDIIAKTNSTESITTDQWKRIVYAKKRAYDESVETDRNRRASSEDAVLGAEVDSDIQVSSNPRSCWMTYRQVLLANGFDEESIQNIASSSSSALRRMSRNTVQQPSKKGMIVGYVQSGKTANMAGMMAIGADNGYNFFIVLSGTIENLRRQTQERLFNDLNTSGNVAWQSLENLRVESPVGSRLSDLHLRSGNRQRYMTVLLKNSRRLDNLLSWLSRGPDNRSNMKLVIIDDEADQAGINTACVDDERTRINSLIVNLTNVQASAVNYLAFTATPYANFLNEAYPESLYPKDFILTLPQPKKHFGPKQIFGLEGRMQDERTLDGLEIIRRIETTELPSIRSVHTDAASSVPASMKDAVSWFLCTSAVTRQLRDPDPRTMLIHTSCRTEHHRNVASAIFEWLRCTDSVFKHCNEVWLKETKEFDKGKFASQFPEYPCSNEIQDYPDFSDIFSHINDLLEEITHIPMNEDQTMSYHRGIHLCIDNSTEEEVIEGSNQHVRLLYPSGSNSSPDFSPAFIVIGGNTLSRGLTLQGLTSTYFLRSSSQMDTLMQMGRWFGFRSGYELLPRIWMTKDTLLKFKYMTLAEQELREELRVYMEPPFVDPSEIAPRVKNSPSFSWLRPTARNRMQRAEPVDLDFSGASLKQPFSFAIPTSFYITWKSQMLFYRNSMLLLNHHQVWGWYGKMSSSGVFLNSLKKWISIRDQDCFPTLILLLTGISIQQM